MKKRGHLYMLISVFVISVMAAFVKATPGISTQGKLFFRGIFVVIFTASFMRKMGVGFRGKNMWGLFFRGLSGHLALSCYFYSIDHLPLADAIMIQSVSPVLISLLAPLLLREKTHPGKGLLGLVALLGVALVLKPRGDTHAFFPALIALLGACFSTLSHLTVRKLSQTEHPLRIVLFFPLVSVILATGPALQSFHWPTVLESFLLIAIGLTAALGQIALTKALQLEKAADISILWFLGIVFGVVFGILFFREIPDRWSWVGMTLIVASSLSVTFGFDRKRVLA